MPLLSGAMEFWLKNTFTVESYIFDKKQKKRSLSDKAIPRDVRFDKVVSLAVKLAYTV
jgi:hypothetical protein